MIPNKQRSLPTDHLGTSKCKAVAGTAVRTTANKAAPITFLKRRRLPGNSALRLFSSVGKLIRDIANHFVTRRELLNTLNIKMDAKRNVRFCDCSTSALLHPSRPKSVQQLPHNVTALGSLSDDITL